MYQSDYNNVIRPRKTNEAWTRIQGRKTMRTDIPTYTVFSDNDDYKNDHSTKYVPIGFERSKIIQSPVFGDVERKEKKKRRIEAFKKYAQEYCSGTSLHGLRYVGIEGVTLFERLFWVLSFILAICFSAYFISNIYQKWNFTPVIVGINPKFKSISSIPFPAITICNMNQVKKSVAKEIIKNENEVELLLLDDFCNMSNSSDYENITDQSFSRWDTVKKFMVKVMQPCSEMITSCQWQGVLYSCGQLINTALTDEGICCTFNRVASEYMYHHPWQLGDFNITFPLNNIDWSPEEGYPDNITTDTWPFRPQGAGSHLGLTLVANVNAGDYYCSSTNSVGLKVRMHSPVETPMVKNFGFFLHPRKENRVAIYPSVDEASRTIFDIPIEKRQCLFSYERNLFFYRTYTKNNCEMECLSNYTLEECKCVPYYLPKNVQTKICGKKKEQCYKSARAKMESALKPQQFCNCLPACYEISYTADVSIGDISNENLRKPYINVPKLSDVVVIHFYFSSTQFRSYQKSELFGFTEFLANSGGLLGLFLGFSFLSAVEIGYHITLKLWCVYYKKQRLANNSHVYPFAK